MLSERAQEILEAPSRTRTASQCFDVAIDGCVELMTAGDWTGAEAAARAVFGNWESFSESDPAWAAEYAAERA